MDVVKMQLLVDAFGMGGGGFGGGGGGGGGGFDDGLGFGATPPEVRRIFLNGNAHSSFFATPAAAIAGDVEEDENKEQGGEDGEECWVCGGDGVVSQWLSTYENVPSGSKSRRAGTGGDEKGEGSGSGAIVPSGGGNAFLPGSGSGGEVMCPVCCCEPAKYGLSTSCSHFFCSGCCAQSLEAVLNAGQFPPMCPSCRAEKGNDGSSLDKMGGLIETSALTFLQERGVITAEFQFRFVAGVKRNAREDIDNYFPCPNQNRLKYQSRGKGGPCGAYLIASEADVACELIRRPKMAATAAAATAAAGAGGAGGAWGGFLGGLLKGGDKQEGTMTTARAVRGADELVAYLRLGRCGDCRALVCVLCHQEIEPSEPAVCAPCGDGGRGFLGAFGGGRLSTGARRRLTPSSAGSTRRRSAAQRRSRRSGRPSRSSRRRKPKRRPRRRT